MRYFLIIMMLYNCSTCFSQVVPVQGVALNPVDQSIFSQWASEVDAETSGKIVEGTPYLLNEWTKGELTTIKGEHYKDVDLKLNLFTDQLIYRNPFTKDSTLIMAKFLTSYSLQNKDTTYRFHYIPPGKDQESKVKPEDFYLVLYDAKSALLARPEVKIKRATKNSMVNSGGQIKDKYSKSNQFFFRDESGKIATIKSSKKAFAKALPSFQEEVKQFMKDNKSDLANAQDLVAIVVFYNSML